MADDADDLRTRLLARPEVGRDPTDGDHFDPLIQIALRDDQVGEDEHLGDFPRVGRYRVGWVGVNNGPRIARADVADFLLKQATDATYLGQLPMISA